MPENPLSRGARGGVVTMLGQLGKLTTQLAGVVILSRLITPEDFGLIAMVAVFVGIGELLRDFGMPTAALRANSLSQAQASNFFWANTFLGLIASALLIASTPVVVAIYGQPQLSLVMPVLALAPLLNGAQAQLQVRLARQMKFRAIAISEVSANLIALILACGLALIGAGYWALVAQTLAVAITLLGSRWVLSGWTPSRPMRGVGSRSQLTSGSHFGIAQALTYTASNADTLVIGAQFGSEWAGYYNRAFQLLTVPVNSLLGPLTQVVVPTINSAVKAGQRETDVLLKVQFALGSAIVWIFLVSAATAPQLIPLVLGPNWQESVLLFQIFAIGGSVQVFSYISYWAFILGDHGKHLIYYNLVTKPLAIALMLIGSLFGPLGVALGYSAGLLVSWPINLAWLAAVSNHESRALFASGLRVLVAAALAYFPATLTTEVFVGFGAIGSIAVGTLTATIIFGAALTIFPGGRREAAQAWRAGRSFIRRAEE